MRQLPPQFIEQMHALLGDSADALCENLRDAEPQVSVRVNTARGASVPADATAVPWCPEGFYIDGERPSFTFDPLWHAGCYYVQDASSMFISHVIRTLITQPVSYLDLCAAPGGKATAAIQALPAGSTLVANEVVPARAKLLADNIARWGAPGVTVTSATPADFGAQPHTFDVVAVDAPCSGEGMMRKEPVAVSQWSPKLVAQCAERQRAIISDVWNALRPGGLFIYSTCTFNRQENEDIAQWIAQQFGATNVAVPIADEWGIAPALCDDLHAYRFFPHRLRGEGLFMTVFRKSENEPLQKPKKKNARRQPTEVHHEINPSELKSPRYDVDYATALQYLRGESLHIDAPKGQVLITYRNMPLGLVNNLGNRANNLYPKPLRIRSTHLPDTPPHIIKLGVRS